MEPKLNLITAKPEFPPEPQFHDEKKEKIEVPRIVPAELEAIPPIVPHKEEDLPVTPLNTESFESLKVSPPSGMLEQLSKDLDELSKPLVREENDMSIEELLKQNEESQARALNITPEKEDQPSQKEGSAEQKEVPAEQEQIPAEQKESPAEPTPPPIEEIPPMRVMSYEDEFQEYLKKSRAAYHPSYDDLGDPLEEPEDTSPGHPIIKSILLLLCLGAVIVGAWQVCLFLQPSFMQSEALGAISEQSCKYLYCPPMRPLRILDEEMNATGEGKWVVSFMIMNQDMRPQPLPNIELTVESANKSTFTEVFGPTQYTVIPNAQNIQNGTALKFQIPFSYAEGRPTKFTVSVASTEKQSQ